VKQVTVLTAEVRFVAGEAIFPSTASRPDWPTQPPIQWIP